MVHGPAGPMVTPEAVALDFRTANVGSRILAFLLDMVIVVAGIFVCLFAISLATSAAGAALPDWVALSLAYVLLPSWLLGYFIAFETLWRGRTPGKAALGLRVVTKEGGPVRFRHAFIRAVLGPVDFWLGFGFLAVVCILFSRDNQRLGDMVAGTLVLRERSGLPAPAPVTFAPPHGLEPYAGLLDTSRLGADDYQAARSFLLRAPSLGPRARAALAVQLASPLAARVQPPPPAGVPPEAFLLCLAAAYQRRQRTWAPTPARAAAPARAVDPAWPGAGGPPTAPAPRVAKAAGVPGGDRAATPSAEEAPAPGAPAAPSPPGGQVGYAPPG